MENITVEIENGVKELIVRRGDAPQPPELPSKVIVEGHLNTPLVHLFRTDVLQPGLLEDSFIVVCRERRAISYSEYASIAHAGGLYVGRLEMHPYFERFQINTGATFTTFELADLIKMNRSFFPTKEQAMKLVSELYNFEAKVNKEVKEKEDQRGNKRSLYAQVVTSNIPEEFELRVPIFKGMDPQTFKVEVAISANDLTCQLVSPEANDLVHEVSDDLIDDIITEISKHVPGLRIFEK